MRPHPAGSQSSASKLQSSAVKLWSLAVKCWIFWQLNLLTNSGQFWVQSPALLGSKSCHAPLGKLQPIPSSVTHICHTPLSHAPVMHPITPLGLPDISGSQNSSSPDPESLTQPPMNFSQTSLNFSQTSAQNLDQTSALNFIKTWPYFLFGYNPSHTLLFSAIIDSNPVLILCSSFMYTLPCSLPSHLH